jgi:hypothetical protein
MPRIGVLAVTKIAEKNVPCVGNPPFGYSCALMMRSRFERSAATSQTERVLWVVAKSPRGSAGTSPCASHCAASDLYQRFSLDLVQFALERHRFRLPGLGVFGSQINHVARNVRPAQRFNRRRAAALIRSENKEPRFAENVFHRDGEPVGDFRKARATACVAAGLGKMICLKCEQESADRTCEKCEGPTLQRENLPRLPQNGQ